MGFQPIQSDEGSRFPFATEFHDEKRDPGRIGNWILFVTYDPVAYSACEAKDLRSHSIAQNDRREGRMG